MIVSTEWLELLARLQEHYTRYGDVELGGQIIKVQEELGEVAEAYIGWSGSNPRKGTTHSRHDIAMELADVVMTAALGIMYAGFEVNGILAEQAKKAVGRLDDFDAGR